MGTLKLSGNIGFLSHRELKIEELKAIFYHFHVQISYFPEHDPILSCTTKHAYETVHLLILGILLLVVNCRNVNPTGFFLCQMIWFWTCLKPATLVDPSSPLSKVFWPETGVFNHNQSIHSFILSSSWYWSLIIISSQETNAPEYFIRIWNSLNNL